MQTSKMATSAADTDLPDTMSDYDVACRGLELSGLDIYQRYSEDISTARVQELMAEMNADIPTGGTNMVYGSDEAQHLHFWPGHHGAPLVVYIHGGSWQIGTHMDSIGSAKVRHLTKRGYAFATINFTLFPKITVKEQAQEIARSISFLIQDATNLGIDPSRIILMGHSSGAHIATLLGTDSSYLSKEGLKLEIIAAVIALDGSNYNALADIIDSPGGVADNMLYALGKDPTGLKDMSPISHTSRPNAQAFLFLNVQRHGGIRQATELATVLNAAGTKADVRVFEGLFFEGHIRLLLRLGQTDYPATQVLDEWLNKNVPSKR